MDNFGFLSPVLMLLDADRILGIASIVTAGVALGIGFYHLYEIRKVTKSAKAQLETSMRLDIEIQEVLGSMKMQLDKMERLEKTTSTRFLDEFPKFIPQIIDLIKEAQRSLVIFCDIPAYGNFSDHLAWKRYCRAIEDTKEIERFTLELVCLSPESRLKSYDEFPLHEWDQWKEDHIETLRNFLWERKRFWFGSGLPDDDQRSRKLDALTRDDFKHLLEETNNEMLVESFANIEPQFMNGARMPAFFWLADDKNAIFSIPARRENHTELGFMTSDSQLINALKAIRERYLAQPITSGSMAIPAPVPMVNSPVTPIKNAD